MSDFQVIVYHKGCSDGIAAVWSLLHHIHPTYIIPCLSKDDADFGIIKEPHEDLSVLYVDIAPRNIETVLDFKRVVILDHHKSAMEYLESVCIPDTIEFIFDAQRSGSQIAWDYHSTESRHWFVEYTGDRDLRTNKLPLTEEVNYALFKMSVPFNVEKHFLETKLPLEIESLEKYQEMGKILIPIQKTEIEIGLKTAFHKFIHLKDRKYSVWVSMTQQNVSELGYELARKKWKDNFVDFVCFPSLNLWKGVWSISIRGHEEGPDLSEVATLMGGGGNPETGRFDLSFEEFGRIFIVSRSSNTTEVKEYHGKYQGIIKKNTRTFTLPNNYRISPMRGPPMEGMGSGETPPPGGQPSFERYVPPGLRKKEDQSDSSPSTGKREASASPRSEGGWETQKTRNKKIAKMSDGF
jgi:hypothetical protein